MTLNKTIGDRLRIIRGKRTQELFIKKLDLIGGISRSSYSMVEIGKRPANLKLLDMISDTEHVSYDYMVGIVDSKIDIHDHKYHQLLEKWSLATELQKDQILQYALILVKREE